MNTNRQRFSRPQFNKLTNALIVAAVISLSACGGGSGSSALNVVPVNGTTVNLYVAQAIPADNIGGNGDYFFNAATGQLLGPKLNGVWPTGSLTLSSPNGSIALSGSGNLLLAGAGTPSNLMGNNGDFYLNVTTNSTF